MNCSKIKYRNKPSRFRMDELGGLEMVCHKKGGGQTTTQYVQSPEQAALYAQLSPIVGNIFPGGTASQNLYSIPDLNYSLPSYGGMDTSGLSMPKYGGIDLSSLPNFQDVDVSKYIPGGSQYQAVADKIAPAFWDTYNRDVQDPLISRFASSGTLGSPVAGVSGAGMDALADSRSKAGNQITSQVYQAAQAPLMQAMQNEQQGNLAEYESRANAAVQNMLAANAGNFNAGVQQALLPWQAGIQNQLTGNAAEYSAGVNQATSMAQMPWQAKIQELQYPYQILPGMLGGSMSTPVTTSQSGGKK